MASITIERPGYKVGPEALAAHPDWLYLTNRMLKIRPPTVAEAEAYALRHHDERWTDLYVQYPQAADQAAQPARHVAQHVTEPVQEPVADEAAETGPAEPQPAAQDATDAVTDAQVNT